MRHLLLLALFTSLHLCIFASVEVASPDGRLRVSVAGDGGTLSYSVTYDGRAALLPSRLGLTTDRADFATGLTITGHSVEPVVYDYELPNFKRSHTRREANRLDIRVTNVKKQTMTVRFQVSDNDIAFRYILDKQGDAVCQTVTAELTAFRLPADTRGFLSPQARPRSGWMETKPSYEEVYANDKPLAELRSQGCGYVFPTLLHTPLGGQGGCLWLLISETGTDGRYAACHLSDYNAETGFTIAFPNAAEAHGYGNALPNLLLPTATPWRTITVADRLAPIVETTVTTDVVEPKYKASQDYKPGRYTWSWLIGQDNSINYKTQQEFIDLAARMGYEYTLVDNWWDERIGRDSIAILSKYAQSKGVRLLLWYNSNGMWNDAPQTPKHCLSTALARRKEMAWLRSIGVAGIKVDFFGSDKQPAMQLYEDILADANDFGLQVIFHGCTLPRGWERMYPNFVASEAVLASENVYFTKEHAAREPYDLTLHPFCRNAVASMDWGGVIMNRNLSTDNKSRHDRVTTNVFEMASAITNQCSVQGMLLQPNTEPLLNDVEREWLRTVPTVWDATELIDGYPGQYVVLARSHGSRTITAALNAADTPRKLTVTLPYAAGTPLSVIIDSPRGTVRKPLKMSKKRTADITLAPHGGAIIEAAY